MIGEVGRLIGFVGVLIVIWCSWVWWDKLVILLIDLKVIFVVLSCEIVVFVLRLVNICVILVLRVGWLVICRLFDIKCGLWVIVVLFNMIL